jgi:hypothetical protein
MTYPYRGGACQGVILSQDVRAYRWDDPPNFKEAGRPGVLNDRDKKMHIGGAISEERMPVTEACDRHARRKCSTMSKLPESHRHAPEATSLV